MKIGDEIFQCDSGTRYYFIADLADGCFLYSTVSPSRINTSNRPNFSIDFVVNFYDKKEHYKRKLERLEKKREAVEQEIHSLQSEMFEQEEAENAKF